MLPFLILLLPLLSDGDLIFPDNRDSAWAEWSLWSTCSVTCGKGLRSRFRQCKSRQRRSFQFPEEPDDEFEFIQDSSSINERQKPCSVQRQINKCKVTCIGKDSPYVCDFSDGICHMDQDVRNDFDWSIKKNSETNESEVDTDNNRTFGKNLGSYLSTVSGSSREREGKSRILTPWLEKSEDGYCLQFWYNVNGTDVKFLKVYLQTKFDERLRVKKVWEAEGDHGDFWLFDAVSFPVMDHQIRVIFEAIVGRVGSVSLDDVTINYHVCLERRRNYLMENSTIPNSE